MNRRYLFLSFILVFVLHTKVLGGPVRTTDFTYMQPDGSTFAVKVIGDEWTKVRKTSDGCVITQDEDGWWCYGIYDSDGRVKNTGFHVGKVAPSEILNSSRQIPYETLTLKAKERRLAAAGKNTTGFTETIRRQVSLTKSGTEKITQRGIVLLVQFSDTKFKYTKDDFINLLNKPGYNGTGSVKDYFESQFGENWEFNFDVSDKITLQHPVRYYGANDADGTDIRPWDMVEDACKAADPYIDFSKYDMNNDGIVDYVYVFYAGESEAENTDSPDLIWPHQFVVDMNSSLDGKTISRYACSSEISGRAFTNIGSFCHEYGHTFGLVDLYDTDYEENGWTAGTWRKTSLMDGGNYNNNAATPPNFNCIEREMLGLSQPEELKDGNTYTLEPIHLNGQSYRMNTDTEGEYYLFECRSNDGWDKYIGGNGMLVYHIDKNSKEIVGDGVYSKWIYNSVNAHADHQCADLIEADGRSDKIIELQDFNQSISEIFFPSGDITSIASSSLRAWNGYEPVSSITGIRRSGNNVSFSFTPSSDIPLLPTVTNHDIYALPDAVVIYFESSSTLLPGKPSVNWKKSGSEEEYVKAQATEYSEGKYVCKIEGLKSGNISYEVLISFDTAEHVGRSTKLSFMTKREASVSWPYLYIVKTEQGNILHIMNADDAEEIIWSYDGVEFTPSDDLRFNPEKDGILKVNIFHTDGSCDMLLKEFKAI